jgi:hypothetical protein
MFDRVSSFVIAVSLAFLAWLYARGRDPEVLDNVPIPVQVALAPGQAEHYDLEVNGPAQVPVSFKGPPSRVRKLRDLLQRGEIQVEATVAVPEERKNENRYLDTIRVDAADVHAPPGVTPVVVEGRNRIPITVRRIVQRRMPVRLEPPPDDRVSLVVIEPETVLVRGPKVIVDRLRAIPTQACLLSSANESGDEEETVNLGQVPLARELEGRPVACTPEAVAVRLTFRPRERVYELTSLSVDFLCPPNFALHPRFLETSGATTKIEVAGPAAQQPAGITAYVDLTRQTFKPGIYVNEPLHLQLPKEFRLIHDPPRAGAFELIPASDRAPGIWDRIRGW